MTQAQDASPGRSLSPASADAAIERATPEQVRALLRGAPRAQTPGLAPGYLAPSAGYVRGVLGVLGQLLATAALLGAIALGLVASMTCPLWAALAHPALALLGAPLALIAAQVALQLRASPRSPPIEPRGLLELTLRDHPALDHALGGVCALIGAKPPDAVYVSASVNAAASMHEGAGRMVVILGLGLVNWLNVSQLLAVLTHELAHTSQRAMRLGLWVEAAQRALWRVAAAAQAAAATRQRAPARWRVLGVPGRAALLILGAAARASARRLAQAYARLAYALELHADRVAASVTGSAPLVSALRELEQADACMSLAMRELQEAAVQRLWTDDLIHHQRLAAAPQAARAQARGLHPRDDARAAHLGALQAPQDERPAWALFERPEQIRRALTLHLWRQSYPGVEPALTPAAQVQAHLDRERAALRWPAPLDALEAHWMLADSPDHATSAQETPAHEGRARPKPDALRQQVRAHWQALDALVERHQALRQDELALEDVSQAIQERRPAQARGFIWRGRRHDPTDLQTLLEQLEHERQRWHQERAKLSRRTLGLALLGCAQDDARRAALLRELREHHQMMEQLVPLLERAPQLRQAWRWLQERALSPEPLRSPAREELAELLAQVHAGLLALAALMQRRPIRWPQDDARATTQDQLVWLEPMLEPLSPQALTSPWAALMLAQFEEIFDRLQRVARKDAVSLLHEQHALLRDIAPPSWQSLQDPE